MTPEDRSREYAPEEWYVDQLRVLLLTPCEADAHDPTPPYQYASASGTAWYDTFLGRIACWLMLFSGLFAFWFVFGWLMSRAA